MTKVQNPIIGRAKGSAGGMTFSKNYDKNVMRAKAFEVNNPNTQAQQTQRGFFKELQDVVGGFTPDQLRCLFPNKPKAMSRRNALSKQIAEYYSFDGTTKSIDFADIITIGNSNTMDLEGSYVTTYETTVNVDLPNKVKQNQELQGNYFIAILVNDTKKQLYLSNETETVMNGTLSLRYPSGWTNQDSYHAIPLITDDTEGTQVMAGFDKFKIKFRPAKQ